MKDLYSYEEIKDGFKIILYDQIIVPYTRQTQMSKWKSKAAQKYNNNQRILEQLFSIIGLKENINFIEKGKPISLSIDYKMLRDKHSNNTKRIDTSNIFKAVEDAMQKVLFANDTQVYHIECYKGKSDRNIVTIELRYGTGDEGFL